MNVNPIGAAGQSAPTHITTRVTTMSQLWTTLGQLRTSDPTAFSSFASNAATELQSAAANQPEGKTKGFLNALANVLQNAATDPNAPLQFANTSGNYIPREHPVAEGFIRSLNGQAQALLQTNQS